MTTIPARVLDPLTGSDADLAGERAVKRKRLLDILDQTGRDSLLLTSNTAMTNLMGTRGFSSITVRGCDAIS